MSQESSVYNLVDSNLVLEYSDHYEAHVLGLKAGQYKVKVEGYLNNKLIETVESDHFTVLAHDRSGFAFTDSSIGKAVGAYNADGTLKTNAQVIYVNDTNVDTITLNVVTNSKGSVTSCVGLEAILAARQKGYDTTPLAIRFIGKCSGTVFAKHLNSSGYIQIKGKSKDTLMNMTLEGVGRDTMLSGIGILIRNSKSVEVRNLAVSLFKDDGVSMDTDNSNIWIHNCDFFYGGTGSDSDQAKGDGSCDTKSDSKYVTVSYCHFWDSGKVMLCGMTSESGENYITYHHNWFDHSDSRHPRVRTMTVHVYNNFYDGVSKYGVGSTMGSSVFVENNYFLNSRNPMLISMQGTDIASGNGTFSSENGGIIKSYGNVYEGTSTKPVTYQKNNKEFDCYEASTRDEVVPATVIAKKGGTTYNNFDTSSKMYSYSVETPQQAMQNVKAYAGRLQGGDFKWEFTTKDNTDYEVNPALKNALINYTSLQITKKLGNTSNTKPVESSSSKPSSTSSTIESSNNSSGSVVLDGMKAMDFMDRNTTDENGYFTVTGNTSNSKGSTTYNDVTYSNCLKMESSTSISFTCEENVTLILVFGGSTNAAGKSVKINGNKQTVANDNTLVMELTAGTHTITKGDSINLFYIMVIAE